MSPVTHFLASWVLGSLPRLERRDIALVAFAGVAPDLDGLGIIPELLTRNSSHALEWFSRYHHHITHNLPFALLVSIAVFLLSKRKWPTTALAFLAAQLHFVMDIAGSRGPDGYAWPIPYFAPFSSKVQLVWSGQWALNSWQNVALTVALVAATIVRTLQTGRSPVEIFSASTDKKVVAALRMRLLRVES